MTQGEILLEAIKADSADDLPRLAYADFLEEQGHERAAMHAEFIRDSIRAVLLEHDHRYMPATSPPLPKPGCQACRALKELRPLECWAEDYLVPAYMIGYLTWRRGFVAAVCCPLSSWLACGSAVAQLHPIQRVELTDREPLSIGFNEAANDPLSGRYCWCVEGIMGEGAGIGTDELPMEILKLIDGARLDGNPYLVYHQSREQAISALSDALILWARSHNTSTQSY
jgi:uncharacterized protein (TIGR02996 family)